MSELSPFFASDIAGKQYVKSPLIEQKFKDLTDVLKGAAASLAGYAGRIGARVLFLFFAGNFYGAARLGELASMIAVIEILVMLGTFGFRRSLLEILGKEKRDESSQYNLILTALTFTLIIATALAIGLALVWDFVGLNMKTPLYPLFAFIITFMALMEVLLTAIRFKRIVRYEVYARSLVEPWTIALATITFYFLGVLESGLLLAYMTALLAASLFALWGFSQEYSLKKLLTSKIEFSFMKRITAFSGPTALVDAIGLAFRRADIIALSFLTPDFTVGIYYGIQNLATVLQKTRHVFDPILSPVVNQTMNRRSIADAGQQLSQVCRWILTILCLELALMAFYAGPLLGLIGQGFAAGGLALVIVLAAEAIEGTFASAELPFVFKRPGLNLMLTATGFSAHIIGLYFLIPQFGMVGAAMSFAIAITLLNSMRLVAIWNKFHISLLRAGYLKPIAAGVIAYYAIHYANQVVSLKSGILVLAGIALGIAVYVAIFWILKPSREDREFVAYLRTGKKPVPLTPDHDFDQI